MNELEVTWGRVLTVWWSLLWRSVLFGFLAGFIVGLIIGLFGGLGGATQETIVGYSQMAGGIAGAIVSIWVMRTVLKKRFATFRIALLAVSDDVEPAAA